MREMMMIWEREKRSKGEEERRRKTLICRREERETRWKIKGGIDKTTDKRKQERRMRKE